MSRKIQKLSIIIPVYYNEENLYPLYDDLKEKVFNLIDYDYEIVMVNDGSKDKSWQVMQELAGKDSNIRIISLSKNFGSHAALLCGLCHCTGDMAAIKAADLQEPSELILDYIKKWEDGYNVIIATREKREDSKGDVLFANLYYKLVRKIALPNMPENGFDNYAIDRKVIEVLKNLDERNSALTGQILWSGFKTARIPYVRKAREIGQSKWTLKKKIRLVSDTLFSFSLMPIKFITSIGVLSSIGTLIWAIVILVEKVNGNIPIEGWTTSIIVQLFSFGIIMITMGILGEYLWRTFDASRNRPPYIIEEDGWNQDSRKQGEN